MEPEAGESNSISQRFIVGEFPNHAQFDESLRNLAAAQRSQGACALDPSRMVRYGAR